jgi:hypothetical protein
VARNRDLLQTIVQKSLSIRPRAGKNLKLPNEAKIGEEGK